MNHNHAFGSLHPVVNFIFFIGALAFGMLIIHPVFSVSSIILSIVFYLTLKRRGWKLIAEMIPIFLALSLLNPVFNTAGDTVLFTYLNGRPYTMEALIYGICLGAMFVSIIMWFASYNIIMTSDKFLFCFGKLSPSVSMILTMVLRLVPQYRKKVEQISGARRCIGKGGANGTYKEKAANGLQIVSVLTSWSLESGIMTADSMRSRGYGCGKQTCFSIYPWRKKEKMIFITMLLLAAIIVFCIIMGGMKVQYIPTLELTFNGNVYSEIGLVSYILFLAIPSILNIMEKIIWHISKSRI